MQHHPQQDPSQIFNTPPALVTTDQIQKCLDENYWLILAIMDNQELGKLAESAQYEDQLQRNLTYLADVADAQPEPQTASCQSQVSQQPTLRQQGHLFQHQSAITEQKPGAPSLSLPPQMIAFQYNDPRAQQQMIQFHHHQLLLQQQGLPFQQLQMPMAGPMGLRIGLNGSAYNTMQYGLGHPPSYVDSYSREYVSEASSSDVQGKSSRFG